MCVAAGGSCFVQDSQKVSVTVAPRTVLQAERWSRKREWSSSHPITSTSVFSARRRCVKSDCHSSFGRSASKRFQDVRGRFWVLVLLFLPV